MSLSDSELRSLQATEKRYKKSCGDSLFVVVESPLWDGCGSLLDGRVLWWMSVLVSMEKELGSGL